MSQASERRAALQAARDKAAVEGRRERQRQGATIRVPSTRGNSNVDKTMGRTAQRPR